MLNAGEPGLAIKEIGSWPRTMPEEADMSGYGQLKHGNPSGPRFGPDWPGRRCGAQCKRTGLPCRAPAVRGRNRCRLQGGRSTGPRTKEAKDRLRRAASKHGLYAGPYHPTFGEMPGPLWPGLGEERKWLRSLGIKLPRITLSRPKQPRDAKGRFCRKMTADELAAMVRGFRDR
jgi:hypothetical protein